MAQPFETRLATGLKSHAQNIETVTDLIAETRAERDRQLAIYAQANADSTDPLLNSSDRDEAAASADRAQRLAQAYANAIEQLEAKLAAKLESDTRKAEQAEKAAALAERDEIAGELTDFAKPMLDKLVAILARNAANIDRMKAAGMKEASAEAVARGVPASFYNGPNQIDQLARMKIPVWGSHGRAWPVDQYAIMMAKIAERQNAADIAAARHQSPGAVAARKAAEDARWAHYTVRQAVYAGHRRSLSYTQRGHSRPTNVAIGSEPFPMQLPADMVERLRSDGFTVEPAFAEADAA